MTDPKDDVLDDLFAQARATPPQVGADLMGRVLADADQTQAQAGPQAAPIARQGYLVRIMESLGGWSAVGGLTAATLIGVWIGAAPPEVLDDVAAGLSGEVLSLTLFDQTSFYFEEGLADG
ncbi:hypothetical protein [Yoonia sediminilitoris]|nr:hypothetical protein [Yoonia sediminilitoris]